MSDVQMANTPLQFHFEKSNFFRVIHVDGAVGSVSPGTKLIHMGVFNERAPIPKQMVYEMKNGVQGAEIASERAIMPGVFREIEADLVMSIDTAMALRSWLDERIREVATALAFPV